MLISCCLLPQTNMAAGHFSQTGIFDHARDEAFHFAFIIWALSACPDGQGGESDSVFVFHIVFALIGAGVILAVAGEPPCGSLSRHRPTEVMHACLRCTAFTAGFTQRSSGLSVPWFGTSSGVCQATGQPAPEQRQPAEHNGALVVSLGVLQDVPLAPRRAKYPRWSSEMAVYCRRLPAESSQMPDEHRNTVLRAALVLVICYCRSGRGTERVSLKELKMRTFPAQSGYREMDLGHEPESLAAPPLQPLRPKSPTRF